MATKPLKNPGVTGGNRKSRSTMKSPLAPTGGGPSGMAIDDANLGELRGTLRPRAGAGVGGPASEAAAGVGGSRGRTATNASAQFRITSKLPGPTVPEAQKTLANARTVPSVMGGKQSFLRGMATL